MTVAKSFCVVLVILIFASNIFSQDKKDSVNQNKAKFFAYPFAFYTPETELAFGAGGIVSYNLSAKKKNPKLSSVTLSGYYTTNSQYSISISPELFIGKDETKIAGKVGYDKSVDKFYGIGKSVQEFDSAAYLQNNFIIYFTIQTRIFDDRLKLGLSYERRNLTMNDKESNPFLLENTVTGSNGGIVAGMGLSGSWDSRDDVFFPTKGGYYEFIGTNFWKFWGSSFEYSKLSVDLRRFFRITPKSTIGLQLYLLTENKTPPFYDLGLLGSDTKMRGYFTGRYRDRTYYTVQSEYRISNVFWKIGFVVFGGFGDVASSLGNITISTVKPSYGAGLRFRFDEKQKLDLRVDIGIGRGTKGFYFGVKQAF